MSYIVIWKDQPGQQVSTVVDADNAPAFRSAEYLSQNGIPVIKNTDVLFGMLDAATGDKLAITPETARNTLGWDFV